MRQTGAAGLGLSPPRFKRLLTIFLDFAGLFGASVSLLRHLSAIRQGWTAAIRSRPGRAGMTDGCAAQGWGHVSRQRTKGPGGSGKTAGSRGDGCMAIVPHLPFPFHRPWVAEKLAAGS